MRERFETKSKSNLLKEIEDILADATQSELSSIKESIVDRRNSMRTGKTQMEELGSTQSTVSTTMLKQNMGLDPLGENLDSRSKSKFQPRPLINSDGEEAQLSSNQSRPLINDDEEEAKLSSNQSIASSEKGGTRLSTPLSTTDQPSTLINGDEEEAQLPSHQSTKSSDKGEARLSPQQ